MDFYGLKSCDTCRKALKSLRAAGHEVTYIDVRDDGVPEEVLGWFLVAFGDDLVNRRSTTWRNLSEEERAQDAMTLLQAHPTLMKRPVIHTEQDFYLGWGKDVQARLLGAGSAPT